MPVKRGDIVLLPVPDTSGKRGKVRPALVVSSDHNNQRLQDVIVAVITGTTHRAKLEATQSDFETSDAFSELEKLVLRYAVAMTQTPVEVSDELFDSLRRHFTSKQLVEITSAIAWENYRARFDHAFGAEAEGFRQGHFVHYRLGRNTPFIKLAAYNSYRGYEAFPKLSSLGWGARSHGQ